MHSSMHSFTGFRSFRSFRSVRSFVALCCTMLMLLTTVAIMAVSAQPAVAGEPETTLARANEFYKNGKYKQSIEEYERLITSGSQATEVYFNLGNAHFKAGNVPAAILNFERAKRLAPNDEDVDFNLAVAQAKIADKIDPAPRLFIINWWNMAVGFLSANEWATIALVAVWLLFAALSAFFVINASGAKKALFTTALTCLIVAGATLVFAWRQHRVMVSDRAAIVFAPSVPVKSAPQDDSKDLFLLHEGSKVEILESLGDWRKVRIADGSVGWMRSNTVQVI
jgi:tetratricopeptide (TPR) repeat protein